MKKRVRARERVIVVVRIIITISDPKEPRDTVYPRSAGSLSEKDM